MNRTKAAAILLLLLLPALLSCGYGEKTQPETVPRKVSVFKIKETEFESVIEGFGNLSFRSKADITAAVAGTMEEIFFDEGDEVAAGEELATMSNIQLMIRLEQAESELFSAESAMELAITQCREGRLQIESRLIALEKSRIELSQTERELAHQNGVLANKKKLQSLGGMTTEEILSLEIALASLKTDVLTLRKDIGIQSIGFRDEDIESLGLSIPSGDTARKEVLLDINTRTLQSEIKVAEARIKSAGTELQSAAALLEETHLHTPIGGVVGARYIEKGERVQADSRVFTVFDSTEIDLHFQVPEEVGILLRIGQEVELSIDAFPGSSTSAVIRQISPAVDPRSGNISIKAELDNSDASLRPGMFARYRLNYGSLKTALMIPAECLVSRDGNRGLVFRLSGGRAFPVNLELGDEKAGFYEVKNGLNEGDELITNPSPLLQEGEMVNVE